jgi:hypothetical protein
MSNLQKPTIKSYISKRMMIFTLEFLNVIPREIFEIISRILHFIDNETFQETFKCYYIELFKRYNIELAYYL